ncbi:MAG: YfcC family protein [Bacteroidota bacterium]|nr:YfcC family protein [Bacteroidota bacterium]
MKNKKSLPGPIAILMLVIIIAAISTWLLPSGQYNKLMVTNGTAFLMTSPAGEVNLPLTQKTLDSLGVGISVQKFVDGDIRKPISVPGTFTKLGKNPQGFINVLQAPIKGIYDSMDIILFILIIGGFMYVFNETGAMVKGITWLTHAMKHRMPLLIAILTVTLSFFAASYGMGEEALVFYPILVPLFLAAGYDLIVPLAIIFGGTSVGGIPAFSNPFSTIIASNAAGINWMNGLTERLLLWILVTGLLVWYILRYAAKVKKNPATSLVLKIDGLVAPPYEVAINNETTTAKLEWKTKLLLLIYLTTFLTMIAGVVFLKWWTLEMSALFLGSSILIAVITRMKEKIFTREFIKGAESLLSVAFIIGVSRGVTIILNEGHVSDSILFYAANMVQGIPPALFILSLLGFYLIFSLFIQSTSGMAVLTMPIIGALAIMVNMPGREIVNSYMYGMSLMSFIAPTGLILPSLALVNVSLKAWLKFIMPLLFILLVLCAAFLLVGIHI